MARCEFMVSPSQRQLAGSGRSSSLTRDGGRWRHPRFGALEIEAQERITPLQTQRLRACDERTRISATQPESTPLLVANFLLQDAKEAQDTLQGSEHARKVTKALLFARQRSTISTIALRLRLFFAQRAIPLLSAQECVTTQVRPNSGRMHRP